MITLGGDGTILHASSLFKVGAVPPVLSFSMGTLGFLLPFRACVHRDNESFDLLVLSSTIPDVDDFAQALASVFQGKATVLYRMRLSCLFYNKDGERMDKEGRGQSCITFLSFPFLN